MLLECRAVTAAVATLALGQVDPARPVADFVWVDPQIQPRFPAYPAHAPVVAVKALHIAQAQKAQPEAPGPIGRRQPQQPVRDLHILRRVLRPVPVAGLADR